MDLNAIIHEFCDQGGSFEHRLGSHDHMPGLSLSSVHPDVPSPLSLPTLPHVRISDASILSDAAGGLGIHGLDIESRNLGKVSMHEATLSVSQLDCLQEDFDIREKYSLLQEKYEMMESAARAEISELRARLLEAHQQLAEIGIARTVSGCTEKIVARQACEEEMYMSQQNLLVARAEVTRHYERQLWRAQRFGAPDQLVRRLFSCRLEWIQQHCLMVWRAVVVLKPEPQDLRELEVEIRCWEKARRLRLVAFNARKIFSAWRVLAGEHGRGRLRKLIDLAHDSWHVCHTSAHRAIEKQFCMRSSAVASRCFLEWLWRYQRSRQLARFWRWLGKERKLMRRCFVSFLRAVSASRQGRIQILEGMRMAAPSSAIWKDRINTLERAIAETPSSMAMVL